MSFNNDNYQLHQAEDLEHLLRDSCVSTTGTRHFIDIKTKGIYVLWVIPVKEKARLSLTSALERASEFLHSEESNSLYLSFQDNGVDEEKGVLMSVLLLITKLSSQTSNVIELPLSLKERVNDLNSPETALSSVYTRFYSLFSRQQLYRPLSSSEPNPVRRRWILITSITTVCFLILVGVFWKSHHTRERFWHRYDTSKSIGPKYQLQFSHKNVSSWKASEIHTTQKWAFRIDDQSLIPSSLYTPEEDAYQAWFQARYPEKNQIRVEQLYLNETFLSDPFAIQVPTDEAFHTAHCVLALRRYWWAMESGRHICPRDIDKRHMKHCLDSLDELAFPGGVRGPVQREREEEGLVMIWKTKVCFDDI